MDLSESLSVLSILGGQVRNVYFPRNDRVRDKFLFMPFFSLILEILVYKRDRVPQVLTPLFQVLLFVQLPRIFKYVISDLTPLKRRTYMLLVCISQNAF